jgi:hypothetical protein
MRDGKAFPAAQTVNFRSEAGPPRGRFGLEPLFSRNTISYGAACRQDGQVVLSGSRSPRPDFAVYAGHRALGACPSNAKISI